MRLTDGAGYPQNPLAAWTSAAFMAAKQRCYWNFALARISISSLILSIRLTVDDILMHNL